VLRDWRAVVLLAIAIAGAAAFYFPRETPAGEDGRAEQDGRAVAARLMNELMSGKVSVGGPFTLTDQYGARRSLAEFRGKLVLLYFGYTYCPDVCPTDLYAIGRLVQSLGRQGRAVQPLFVTLDPERDTQEVLGKYAVSFHPRLIALRGSEREIRSVATAYKVYYEKVASPSSGSYVIDHTAFIFLLDREGRYVSFFPPGTTLERMAVIVREALGNAG